MVILTAAQFYIVMGMTFLVMVSVPYLVDYVFFVLFDESSWLGASIMTATLGMGVVVVAMKVMGL